MIQRGLQLSRYKRLQAELRRFREEIRHEETPMVVEDANHRERLEQSIRELDGTLECLVTYLEMRLEEEEGE